MSWFDRQDPRIDAILVPRIERLQTQLDAAERMLRNHLEYQPINQIKALQGRVERLYDWAYRLDEWLRTEAYADTDGQVSSFNCEKLLAPPPRPLAPEPKPPKV